MSAKTYRQSDLSRAWVKDRQDRQRQARPKLLSDAAHYWPTDSLPFAYALACTQIVTLHGKADKEYQRIDKEYQRIIEAWALPGCQQVIDGYSEGHFLEYKTWRQGLRDFNHDADSAYLVDCIFEFIKVGFNRESDRANEKWKVVPSLDVPWLYGAVNAWTLADYLGIELEDWNEYRPLVRNGKVYDTEVIMKNKPTHRIHRKVVELFKQYGKQTRDKTLLKNAGQWYKCRVNPGSIEEYMNEVARQTEKDLDQGRISNDIKPFDLATGYPR